ncbi:transposase family protein [Desulfosoma caldarium]|uniref:transposase family protein n=1 Tax=Desulfosoma caldarium TaxID=610254 RepID=UPI0011CE1013|nr:transposase family protein [Desulfosoma caldarium]
MQDFTKELEPIRPSARRCEVPLSRHVFSHPVWDHQIHHASIENRNSYDHCPTMPRILRATLSPIEERVAVELRTTLFLQLDDLPAVTREKIYLKVWRFGLHGCLRRHGETNLNDLALQEQGAHRAVIKSFKDDEPGYIHDQVTYLSHVPDETAHKYLFIAMDRASRQIFFEIKADKCAASASSLLKNLVKKAPFKMATELTDNGKEFTDHF